MFASERSVRKAQGIEHKVVRHNNKSNKRGRGYYVQIVKDKSGKAIKTIVHIMSQSSDSWKPGRKKVRLKKSMEKQPR